MQEHANGADNYSRSAIKRKLIGQVQVIMTVEDPERWIEKGKPATYAGALLELLWPQSRGIDKTTGMLELQPWPISMAMNPRMLRAIRFYAMPAILRSVHVVPDDGNGYYVNNYVDWDTYNTVYDDTFLTDGVDKAKRYKRVHCGG